MGRRFSVPVYRPPASPANSEPQHSENQKISYTESMQPTVQIAERGQITLPKALRDQYAIKPGDVYSVIDLGEGRLMLVPGPLSADRLADQIREQLESQGETLESMLKLARRVRDDDSRRRNEPA
jgi:AbrB family looped-hinge helix DNA binding protein